MKKQYNTKTIDVFWRDYWEACGKDTNRISDNSIYPLFPVDKHINKSWRTLECGCGMGRVLKHYYYQGYPIEGIELDELSVKRLKDEDAQLPVSVGSVLSLFHEDNSFDLVMAFGVLSCLERIQDRDLALREMYRVTKPGGLICCSVSVDNFARWVFRCIKYGEHMWRRMKGPVERHFYSWCFYRQEFARILAEHHFSVVEVQPILTRAPLYSFLPFFRKNRDFNLALARDGDRGYELNGVGESLFKWLKKTMPWQYAEGMVFIARKN